MNLAIGRLLQRTQNGRGLGANLFAFVRRNSVPRLPIKAEKLMQRVRTFERERNGGKISHCAPLPAVSVWLNPNKIDWPMMAAQTHCCRASPDPEAGPFSAYILEVAHDRKDSCFPRTLCHRCD